MQITNEKEQSWKIRFPCGNGCPWLKLLSISSNDGIYLNMNKLLTNVPYELLRGNHFFQRDFKVRNGLCWKVKWRRNGKTRTEIILVSVARSHHEFGPLSCSLPASTYLELLVIWGMLNLSVTKCPLKSKRKPTWGGRLGLRFLFLPLWGEESGRRIYDVYCPYFASEVMVKLTQRGLNGLFEMWLESCRTYQAHKSSEMTMQRKMKSDFSTLRLKAKKTTCYVEIWYYCPHQGQKTEVAP